MISRDIKTVLFPTDFSDIADNALHTAISICVRQGAELMLAHVLEGRYFLAPPGVVPGPLESFTQEGNEAEGKLHNLIISIMDRFHISVRPIVLKGDPAGEICRLAAARHVDMIVMGTHGASGLREFFIGSNAYRVVKHAGCPVMTIPGKNKCIELRKILFPVRLVAGALGKYETIRPIIRKNDSSLLVAGIVKNGDEGAASVMKEIVAIAKRKMLHDGVECRTELHYTEDIAQHVLDLCDVERPDLLVITATFEPGHGFKSIFIGPYTQQIVNHCKIPVLSIRVDPESDAGPAGARNLLLA